jgi:hypothetical protein
MGWFGLMIRLLGGPKQERARKWQNCSMNIYFIVFINEICHDIWDAGMGEREIRLRYHVRKNKKIWPINRLKRVEVLTSEKIFQKNLHTLRNSRLFESVLGF